MQENTGIQETEGCSRMQENAGKMQEAEMQENAGSRLTYPQFLFSFTEDLSKAHA